MKQIIYAVVHCESCYNRDGIFTGRVNSLLTDVGHEHAIKLAKELKDVEIDIAYRSSLTRTQQTLKHILAYHPKTKVIIDDRIIERDYGKLSSIKKSKYKKTHPKLYPIYHRSYDVAPPGGESIQQVEKRVLFFIKDMLYDMKKSKKNILIVAHGNSMRPFRRFFEHMSIEEMMKLENQKEQIFTYKIDVIEQLEQLKLTDKLCGC